MVRLPQRWLVVLLAEPGVASGIEQGGLLTESLLDRIIYEKLCIDNPVSVQWIRCSDLADMSLHRQVKRIVNRAAAASASPATTEEHAACVTVLSAPQFGTPDAMEALYRALRKHGSDGDGHADSNIMMAVCVVSLQASRCPMSVGSPSSSGQSQRINGILIAWLQGQELASRLSAPRDCGSNLNEMAAAAATTVTTCATESLASSGCYDVFESIPLQEIFFTDALRSAMCTHHWMPPLLKQLRVPVPREQDTPQPSCGEVLFLGVCESLGVVKVGPSSSGGAAAASVVFLSHEARRMISTWCCLPNRMVVFVFAGSHASGERFSVGMLSAALTTQPSNNKEPAGHATPLAAMTNALPDCIARAMIYEHVQMGDDDNTSSSSWTVPLTCTAVLLTAAAQLLHASLEASVLVCEKASFGTHALSTLHDLLPGLTVLDFNSVVGNAADSEEELRRKQASWLSQVKHSEGKSDEVHHGHLHTRAMGKHSSPDGGWYHCATPSGKRRIAEYYAQFASADASQRPDDIHDCACSFTALQTQFDTATLSIARTYAVDAYLDVSSITAERVGLWSVVATARCASSNRAVAYQVEAGVTRGWLTYAFCTCKSAAVEKARVGCRHAAALAVHLASIPLSSLSRGKSGSVTTDSQTRSGETHRVDGDSGRVQASQGDEIGHVGVRRPVTQALTTPDVPRHVSYTPAPIPVSDNGLPLHMLASNPSHRGNGRKRDRTEGGDAESAVRGSRSVFSKRKIIFGPNAPKGHRITPFFYFSRHQRGSVLESEPHLKLTEVAKRLGELWRGLSEDERREYARRCDEEGRRWDDEWAAYMLTEEYTTAVALAQLKHREQPLSHEAAEVPDDSGQHVDVEAPPLTAGPAWRMNSRGHWHCEWDEDDYTSDDEANAVVPRSKKCATRLGSVAALRPVREGGEGMSSSSSTSHTALRQRAATTKATLNYASLHDEDDDEEPIL